MACGGISLTTCFVRDTGSLWTESVGVLLRSGRSRRPQRSPCGFRFVLSVVDRWPLARWRECAGLSLLYDLLVCMSAVRKRRSRRRVAGRASNLRDRRGMKGGDQQTNGDSKAEGNDMPEAQSSGECQKSRADTLGPIRVLYVSATFLLRLCQASVTPST